MVDGVVRIAATFAIPAADNKGMGWRAVVSRKKNEAASDLWLQVLSRLSKEENAAVWDPNYDLGASTSAELEAYTKAGWTEAEVKGRRKEILVRAAAAPITSPGMNPTAEPMLDTLCNDIEAAMDRLKLTSHSRVARGLEPRLGPYAAKTNVIMTDESIVTVGVHLFRFCGLIARAYTRTLMTNPSFWGSGEYDDGMARRYLLSEPHLLRYWFQIFVSYAVTGTNVMVPFRPAQKHELVLFEQVARAMETFSISHEYGHHNFAHGKDLNADPHGEEFEADRFALRVSYELERYPVIYPNPYLSSGAGGVLLLLALETLRDVERLFGVTVPAASASHPNVLERIAKFESIAILKPDEFVALRGFRVVCKRVMTIASVEVLAALKTLPPERLKGIVPARFGGSAHP